MRPQLVLESRSGLNRAQTQNLFNAQHVHRKRHAHTKSSPTGVLPAPAPNRRFSINSAAWQKEEDRDFFLDVLGATATKREAKSYLSRFKPQPANPEKPRAVVSTRAQDSGVNLGGLYLPVRSVEESPVFSQTTNQRPFLDPSTQPLRTALVILKTSDEEVDDETLGNVSRTLSQLSRLGLSPIVVVDGLSHLPKSSDDAHRRNIAMDQVNRVVAALERTRGAHARRLDGVLNIRRVDDEIRPSVQVRGNATLTARSILLRPLHRGVIPVVAPLAFDHSTQKTVLTDTKDVVLALTTDLAGLVRQTEAHEAPATSEAETRPVSLDRIIILDPRGGLPSANRLDGSHVFVNLEQEYDSIQKELASMETETSSTDLQSHASNLELARSALYLLPPSSSAFITTPAAASATHSRQVSTPESTPGVGTRPQRNALIHNLLTDKPVFSSSLPLTRLISQPENVSSSPVLPQPPSFIKRGLPITIFPDPSIRPWSPPTVSDPPFSLADPALDLPRLVHLIEDSFGRKLDAKAYFERIAPRLAGIIVAGAYEGGAILTWETPPELAPDSTSPSALSQDPSRLVPYLDKFAVLQRSQGAGGVADVVFNTMTRTCFPHGVAWRSRSANPVNKWYFERAKGSWKIPVDKGQQGWTMFWTTDGVAGQRFRDYEGVCRGIGTNWADGKTRLD